MALHLIYGARGIYLWMKSKFIAEEPTIEESPAFTGYHLPVDIPDGPDRRKILGSKIPLFELEEVFYKDKKYNFWV